MSKDELEQTAKSISNLTLSDDDKQENPQPAIDEPDLESRTEQNRDESPRTNADNSSGPINKLHEDCLAEVFRYLQYNERIKLERVCSHWQVCSVRSWNTITKKGLMDFMFAQNNLTDDIILRILERSTIYLKELCLCFADHNITNPGNAVRIRRNRGPLIFQLLEERAENLKRICWDFVAPGEYVVPFLLKRVSQFRELFLCPVIPAISLENYKKIFKKATNLKKLACSNLIQFCRQEEIMKFLDLLPSTLVSLHLVNIDCNSPITSVVEKFQRISSLKELKLTQLCRSTELNFWEHLSNLTVLKIGGGNFQDSCFPNMVDYFKKNKQLKSLSLYDIEDIYDDDLIALRYLTNLEEVRLAGLHEITGSFLKFLPRSVNLLSISHCYYMEAEFLKNYICSAPLLDTVVTYFCGETFQKCVFEGIETRLKSSGDQKSRDHRCKIFAWCYSSRHGSTETTHHYYQAFRLIEQQIYTRRFFMPPDPMYCSSCKMLCRETEY